MALAMLLLILLNPSREEHQIRPGPQPTAVFLIDESRSMSLESPQAGPRRREQLINRAAALVPRWQRPAIQKYGFGRELFATPAPVEARAGLADETRLGHGLRQLPARFGRHAAIWRVRLLRRSLDRAEPLAATARAFRELGVPVHVVPLGDERISGDVAVAEHRRAPGCTAGDARARSGDRAQPRSRRRAHRAADPAGQRTQARCPGDSSRSRWLTVSRRTSWSSTPTEPRARWPTWCRRSPHEAIAANNVVPFQIMPRQPKLRVIYMEGSPLPEYRYIHDALEEDPNITCVSMGTDNMHAAHPRLYRFSEPGGGYPRTREELLGYDVVICSDISRGAFTPEQLEWTVELVRQARRRVCHDRRQHAASAPAAGTRRSGTA